MVEVKGTLRVTRPDTAEQVWSPEHRERSEQSDGRMGGAGPCASRIQCSRQSLQVGCRIMQRTQGAPSSGQGKLQAGPGCQELGGGAW